MSVFVAAQKEMVVTPSRKARFAVAPTVKPPKDESAEKMLTKIEPWQHVAYSHNKCIPEISFAHTMLSNLFSRGTLRVMQQSSSSRGTVAYEPSKNRAALDVLNAFVTSETPVQQNYYRFALNMLIAGDGYLLGVKTSFGYEWEFVSIFELRREPSTIGKSKVYRVDPHSSSVNERDRDYLPEGSVYYRIHRPDPFNSKLADSAMKHNIELCKQVISLDKVIDTVAMSNINAGMFGVPDELDFDADDETLTVDPNDPASLSDFERAFAALTGTREPDDPFAGTPLLIRGAKEFLPTQENYITFMRPFDEQLMLLRNHGLDRIFRGLDLPVENITGKGDTNAWSAYAVEQDTITKHIQPMGNLLGSFLTSKLLRPMLVSSGMSEVDARKYIIEFDSSSIATKPDMTKTAIELHNMYLISDVAARRFAGIEESDAPTPEEVAVRVARVNGPSNNPNTPGPIGTTDTKSEPPKGTNATPRKRKGQPDPATAPSENS